MFARPAVVTQNRDAGTPVAGTPQRVTHASICCGIGGWDEGFAKASVAGIAIDTQLAVDLCPRVCKAYHELHPRTPLVLNACLSSVHVTKALVDLDPDLTTMSPPCTDYANGLGVEGAAAEATLLAAQLIVRAKLRCVLIENVVAMLSSKTWAKAEALLLAAGYTLYVSKLKGSDFSIGCHRRRAYVLVVRGGSGVTAAVARFGALLNAIQRSALPISVRSVLRCSERCFFWKSRVKGNKSIYATDDCMPSPVRRNPGRPPVNLADYVADTENDAGLVQEARVLSLREMAALLTFTRDLPASGTATDIKLWLVNLVMPRMAFHLVVALAGSGVLDLRADAQCLTGSRLDHDASAPRPEWMCAADHTPVAEPLTAKPNAQAKVPVAAASCTSWQYRITPEMIPAYGLDTGRYSEKCQNEYVRDIDDYDDDDEPCAEQSPNASTAALHGLADEPTFEDSAHEAMRRQGRGNPRVSAAAAMHDHEARSKSVAPSAIDPASVLPGETVVQPPGTPSKQSFGRMAARVQCERRFKEREFVALLDPGAEVSLMSTKEVQKLSPGGIFPLEKGDHSVIELADASTRVKIQGAVYLTLRFGNKLVRHKFYVVDLHITTIFGADFFGLYHTLFDYKDRTYEPLGAAGPKLKMLDSTSVTLQAAGLVWRAAKVTGRVPTHPETRAPPKRCAACLVEDIVIPAHTEMDVEVTMNPPVRGILAPTQPPLSLLHHRRCKDCKNEV